MSTPNLWERAKAQIASLAESLECEITQRYEGREKYPDEMRRYLRDMAEVSEARALLSDMERAECVEGGAYVWRPDGTTVETADFAPRRAPEDRPALLILEKP